MYRYITMQEIVLKDDVSEWLFLRCLSKLSCQWACLSLPQLQWQSDQHVMVNGVWQAHSWSRQTNVQRVYRSRSDEWGRVLLDGNETEDESNEWMNELRTKQIKDENETNANEQMNRTRRNKCKTNELVELNENDYNDNAFYLAVSSRGTAFIASKPENRKSCKTQLAVRTYLRPKAGRLYKIKLPIPWQIGVALTWWLDACTLL